jgi:rare lipoprotein A
MKFALDRRSKIAALLPILLLTAFCARRGSSLNLGPGAANPDLNGIASWYGEDFNGKPTSNREVYDMYAMTAAHKTLPFETRVRVFNLSNGKSTVVRINDRGPFVDGRIIDLSLAAAEAIDMVGPGTAPVRLEILSCPEASSRPAPAVQVGSFLRLENARDLESRLKARFDRVVLSSCVSQGRTYYRVRVKALDGETSAALASRLAQSGYRGLVLEEDVRSPAAGN